MLRTGSLALAALKNFRVRWLPLLKQAVEVLAEQGGRGDNGTQLGETLLVLRTGNPEADVALGRILLLHVLVEAQPLMLVVELGIVGQSEVNGTNEDHLGDDVAVGLGDDLSVERARGVAGRGAVILDGLLHDLYLFGREPALQPGVCSQNLSARQVVYGAGP